MEKDNSRFYILMRFKLEFDPSTIHDDFEKALLDEALSYSTILE
jgi:hypothetical protein